MSMPRGIKLNVTDDALRAIIQNERSWRGVMRALGYATANGGIQARLRSQAQMAGISTGHFWGKSSWPVEEVAAAVRRSTNWSEVAVRLGRSPSSASIAKVRGYSVRLGIDFRHFPSERLVDSASPFGNAPEQRYLRRAATGIAMAWFAHRGYGVALTVELEPYDLIVEAHGSFHRVQVKSATGRSHSQELLCRLSRQPGHGSDRRAIAYDPADLDFFFIVSVDGACYLVPIKEVAGQTSITLTMLSACKVDQLTFNY
jgi:PD-(D/E)XK endonuclease